MARALRRAGEVDGDGVNPHNITVDFERELCAYTGAPFAVAVTSCTMALLLAVAWNIRPTLSNAEHLADGRDDDFRDLRPRIQIPKRTYVSVPQSIIHAGGRPVFRDEDWQGCYQLRPLPVWDCARRFTSGMFVNETHEGSAFVPQFQCVSFHAAKILGDTQGGAILHNDPGADHWFRRARFDGRTPGVPPMDDAFDMLGWHCYLSPDVSARLLFKLSVLPRHNADLPWDPYPDLSQFEIFK